MRTGRTAGSGNTCPGGWGSARDDLLALAAALEPGLPRQQLHELLSAELNAGRPAGLVPCGRRLRSRVGRNRGLHTGRAPLAVILTAGDRNGVTHLMPLLDAIPPIRGHA